MKDLLHFSKKIYKKYIKSSLVIGDKDIRRVLPDVLAARYRNFYERQQAEELRPVTGRPVAPPSRSAESRADDGDERRHYCSRQQYRQHDENLIYAVE